MPIIDEITRLQQAKQDFKTKLIDKGVEVGDDLLISDYPPLLDEIQTGVDTSDATATSEDILLGKTAYVNDVKVVGTIEEYDGEQEGGIDNTQEDGLVARTLTTYSNSRVTSIGDNAFDSYKTLTSVNLPQVTNIGRFAFAYCSELLSLNIPNATIIDDYAFYQSTKIQNIDFPKATKIGENSFYECTSLTSVNLPQVTDIGKKAFYNCYRITTNIDLPNVLFIDEYAFYFCERATSFNLPKLKSIGVCAFYNCQAVTSFDIPNLTDITGSAFKRCFGLISAKFQKVKNINKFAFDSCYSLKALILQSNSVCTLSNTNALTKCYHILGTIDATYNPNGDKDGYIYVPSSLVDSYKSATNWSTHADQIRALSELPQEYKTLYNIA